MATALEKILDTHSKVVEDGFTLNNDFRYSRYALSTLRGGVGKSTLSFNLAFQISRKKSVLVADVCPQCNLTEMMLRNEEPAVTIYSALQPRLLGPAFGEQPDDISYRVSEYCASFKGGKRCYFVPGDAQMFAFPSTLYQQLQIAIAQGKPDAIKQLLRSLRLVLNNEAKEKQCEMILMDTSPFYAGGTHLAWCAAEAVILPVRVDEHSIQSLELTLSMLSNESRDFQTWNTRAGIQRGPKVAAVVMTMVGSKSQLRATPDRASRMYIERAVAIAEKFSNLFDHADPADAFVITDDFVSAGRISGAKSIPISQLRVGQFHTVEGRRLQVNASAERYQNELQYLASVI